MTEPEWTASKVRTIHELSGIEILSVKWNQDDSLIAAACSDGGIRTYSTLNWEQHKHLSLRVASTMPVTSVCWRPELPGFDHKNVLMTTSSDGWVTHWIASTGIILESFRLEGEQSLASDYCPDAIRFALAKRDFSISIYNANVMEETNLLDPGTGDVPGHSNNIFCVKWMDNNCLLSGGWDNTVFMWDIRARSVAASFFGPHICGQAIDFREDSLIAGSFSRGEQLQLFSLSGHHKTTGLRLGSNDHPNMIYATAFNKTGGKDCIAGVGKGISVLRTHDLKEVFSDKQNGDAFCCDWANLEDTFAVGCSGGNVNIYKVDKH